MKINSISNNLIKNRPSFKGYSNPGFHAVRAQIISAEDAERFVNAMKAANRQDATSTNFMAAFVNKVKLAGEILGLKNLNQAAEIMTTAEHKALVKQVDKGVDAMLDATGYGIGKSLNIAA